MVLHIFLIAIPPLGLKKTGRAVVECVVIALALLGLMTAISNARQLVAQGLLGISGPRLQFSSATCVAEPTTTVLLASSAELSSEVSFRRRPRSSIERSVSSTMDASGSRRSQRRYRQNHRRAMLISTCRVSLRHRRFPMPSLSTLFIASGER